MVRRVANLGNSGNKNIPQIHTSLTANTSHNTKHQHPMLHCICRAGPRIALELSSPKGHSILVLVRRISSRTYARVKNKQLVSTSIRPPPHMSRSSRDDEAFRNAMTGLPHANSSAKAHSSPPKLPVASPSARYAHLNTTPPSIPKTPL